MASPAMDRENGGQESEVAALASAHSHLLSGNEVEIANISSARVYKHPGDINGDSLLIKGCRDTHIYIMDHSSDVEVIGCSNVDIYIMRVVDGPALFEDCVGCKIVVASQQFQAKRCKDCWFGIYTVTGPTLSESSGIKFSPWSGDKANVELDPSGNQWLNVYDASEPRGADHPADDSMEDKSTKDPSFEGKPRNFVLGFDPVQVRMLDVRQRGDSSTEESLMVFSELQSQELIGVMSEAIIEAKEAIDEAPDDSGENGSIKAIRGGDTIDQWRKTIDLIDMNNNNNKHLTRFKSVLLSMTESTAQDAQAHTNEFIP